jgi:hypothetical protein
MGRQVHMWFSVLCLFVLMAVSNGHAQSASGTFTARIPFEFSAGNQLFPAGEYKLKALLQHTLSVSNQNRRAATNISTNSLELSEVPAGAKLVFHGYNGSYYLAQVWMAGDNVGHEVIKSSAEKELAKQTPDRQVALVILH